MISAVLYTCASTGVYAQTPPNIPSTAQTGRLEYQVEQRDPFSTGTIIAPEDIEQSDTIPVAADGFVIEGVIVNGMTAFDQSDLHKITDEYLDLNADVRTLKHLANRITQVYRDSGYFLSKAIVPQQDVVDGMVSIQVIEAYVHDVVIVDSDKLLSKDAYQILAKTKQNIKAMKPLHGPTLERYTLLLNDYNLRIETTLLPSKSQKSGAIDLQLTISDKTPISQIEYNNYGSRFVGPNQLIASHQRGGVFNSFDQIQAQVTTSLPFDEIQYVSLSYETPLDEQGLSFDGTVSYSNSMPGYTLEELEVEGDSTSVRLGLNYAYLRSRKSDLNIFGQFNLNNNATEFLDREFIDDKTRSLAVGANYGVRGEDSSYNFVQGKLVKGLDIFGAEETGSDNLSRQDGRSDFWLAQLEASHDRWLSSDFLLSANLRGQYTALPLLSSQEFGYGGIDYGRAYDPSEITGDKGVSASVELSAPEYYSLENDQIIITPFVFYDIGKVWNNGPNSSEPVSAASGGLGIGLNLPNNISANFQAAFPLTSEPSNPEMNGNNSPMILMQTKMQF